MERNEQKITNAALSALSLCVQSSNDAMARMEQQIEQLKAELAYSRAVIAEAYERLRQYPPMIEKAAVEMEVEA